MVQQGAQLKVSCDTGVIQGPPGQCTMQAEDGFHIWSISALSGTDSSSTVDVLDEHPRAKAATAGNDAQINVSSSNDCGHEYSHPSLAIKSFAIDPSTSVSSTITAVPVCSPLSIYANVKDNDSQSALSSKPSSHPPHSESLILSLNMSSHRRQTRSRLDDATFQLVMQGSEQHHENSKEKGEGEEQPTRVLRSILKKTRPIFSHRHPIHSYLDSMLQYQHQYQHQTLMHLQKQQQLQHQNHSSRDHQQQCLSASLFNIDNTASPTELRPLPTPPAVKSVRWASHDVVVEIENVDDLFELGYFDDHDSDIGWDDQDDSWTDMDESENGSEDEMEPLEAGYPLGLYHNQYQHQVYAQEEDEEESLISEDELIQRLSAQNTTLWTSFTSQPPQAQQQQEPKRLTANADMTNIAAASTAPQLDRQKILAEVAERKRNGVGTFARRSGQGAAVVGESSGTTNVSSSSSSSLHFFPTFPAGPLETSSTRGESQKYVRTPPPMRISTNVNATLKTGMRTSPDIMMERWKQDRYRFRSGTGAMDPSKVDAPVAAPHRDRMVPVFTQFAAAITS